MDNWATFLTVNVVLVIVLGVITNLITPWIKSTYERSVFASRKRRVERLIKDYKQAKRFSSNYPLFILYLLRYITLLIGIGLTLIYLVVAEVLQTTYGDLLPFFI